MPFEAGNGLIIPLRKKKECELGIVIDTDKANLLPSREKKINLVFLDVRAEQLNAFHKLCKNFYYLASTYINSGLSVKGHHIQKQTNEKTTRC